MKNVLILVVSGMFWLNQNGFSQDTADLFPDHPGSLLCWSESLATPRLLKIFCLKVNLRDPELKVITLTGEDPDGEGPAESQLTKPIDLLEKADAIAAINTNAFTGIPNDKSFGIGWYEGRPVDIHGMVVSEGRTISPVEEGRTAFWLSADNRPHIGNPETGDSVSMAVSDWFSPLIINDSIIPDSVVLTNHPRTAIGFNDSGRWLLMMVVDGRQPGYSEGISLYELACLFREHGCTWALNLDGGGSSIMLVRESGREVRTMNRPSDQKHRPVPVMLGVKSK
ncbi:MAG: phosphodiester glycosidase family protein [Bacteroidota bacterium]